MEKSVRRMGADYLQEKQDVSCPRGHLINSWTSSSSPMIMMRILMDGDHHLGDDQII